MGKGDKGDDARVENSAAFARPEVERALGDPKLDEPARRALEALGGEGAPVEDRELTWDEVTAEVAKVIERLGRDLPAAGGNVSRERELLAEAYEAYCEVRAAGGDVIPGAYFTRQFIDVGWDVSDEEFGRWMDLAVEVVSG